MRRLALVLCLLVGGCDVAAVPWASNAPFKLAIPDSANIGLFGDSVLAGLPDASYAGLLPLQALVTAHYTAAGHPELASTWQQFSQSGQKLAWAEGLISSMISGSINAIIIGLGTNDASAGTSPLAFQASWRTILGQVRAAAPTKPVGLMSIWFLGELQPAGANANDGAIARYNAITKQMAVEYNCTYLDTRAPSLAYEVSFNTPPPGAASGLLTQDGVHPDLTVRNGYSGVTMLSQSVYNQLTFSI
jgi:lysophospholipase L1-like esterase